MRLKISNKVLCLALDVLILIGMGIVLMRLSSQHPKLHYDIDRNAYPIKGIDISAHNGSIDFAKVKADTVDFVMIKASEGTDFCDANFSTNYNNATAHDLKVGAYHYFRFDTPGDLQARHFLNTISQRQFDLPLAIDVERWGNTSTYEVDSVKNRLKIFIDTIAAAGYPVMIYTNKSDYRTFIQGMFVNVPVWMCTLSSRQPHIDWTFWQHSHAGNVDGIETDVDINTYRGTRQAFDFRMKRYTVEAQ